MANGKQRVSNRDGNVSGVEVVRNPVAGGVWNLNYALAKSLCRHRLFKSVRVRKTESLIIKKNICLSAQDLFRNHGTADRKPKAGPMARSYRRRRHNAVGVSLG